MAEHPTRKARRSPPARFSPGIFWSEMVAVMGMGLAAVVGMAVFVQNRFGPGMGQPWILTPFQVVALAPLLIAALILGTACGTVLWAACARFFLPKSVLRRELTQPNIPIASWFGHRVADWVVGKDNSGKE